MGVLYAYTVIHASKRHIYMRLKCLVKNNTFLKQMCGSAFICGYCLTFSRLAVAGIGSGSVHYYQKRAIHRYKNVSCKQNCRPDNMPLSMLLVVFSLF